MPRKNNPKETIERILSASMELFYKKGFDKTSMQDIIDASDMSKGAIFYHFKSKEEIFDAVMEMQFVIAEERMSQRLVGMKDLNAKEKLIGLINMDLSENNVSESVSVIATSINSPHLTLALMRGVISKSAPLVAEIFREGLKDGSITTEFPDECAEVFLLLYNYWCEPYVFECDLHAIQRRLSFLQKLLQKMGVDIITDEIKEASLKFSEKLLEGVRKWKTQEQ